MTLLAARDLQPLAVDVSCEVLSDTDKPSPDSLPAQLGMDHQRRDATQPAYLVKERDCVEAEKSGKSFSLAENRIRAQFHDPDAIQRGVADRRELLYDE
jgi:hypothetical protein